MLGSVGRDLFLFFILFYFIFNFSKYGPGVESIGFYFRQGVDFQMKKTI